MNILLVGGGGREHAIAWKLLQSPRVVRLFVAPGNGGTAGLPRTENVAIAVDDLEALSTFARQQQVALTIVGPEAPLAAGIVDHFQAAKLRIFGPTQGAALLESSKAFSKQFMLDNRIPTGRAAAFTDFDEAVRYLRTVDDVPVIKASGLAAGKGVVLPATKQEAALVLQSMLLDHQFGAASDTVLIEERLSGPEVSVLAFADGSNVRVMPPAQDHKRLLNKDNGPNTGGMGAFAPSPLLTPGELSEIEARILRPTLAGMAAAGQPYVGVLYAGLMLTQDGPKVLEFNCRLGDPETQVLLPLLESDLLELIEACMGGRLDFYKPRWQQQAAVTVVMAARGYPNEIETGVEITGVDNAEATGCTVFHAGTKRKDSRLVTAGGRVFSVTATAPSIQAAAQRAYQGVRSIRFNGAQFRTDIARKKV